MHLRRSTLLILLLAALVAAGAGTLLVANQVGATGNVGAPVKQAPTNHTISVTGHGTYDAAPDQATLTLGVQTHDTNAQTALSNNAAKMNAVIAAVKAQGVDASRIQTSELSIWYDSQNDTYVVSHQITVRIANIAKVGAILDSAVAAGANNSWGVSFGLKDDSAARSQALQAATADALKRATAIAAGLGVHISGVSSASEASYNVTPLPYGAAAGAPASAPSTQVQPGQLTITADVSVVYTFG